MTGSPAATRPAPGPGARPGEPLQRSGTEQPSRGRTLAIVATEGVAYLVYWLVILILIGAAATSLLAPPDNDHTVGALAAMIFLAWAVFCLAVGVRRGQTPSGVDLAPAVWLPALTAVGCSVTLAMLRVTSGMFGPWPAEMLVALLVVISMTVWAGPMAGGVSTVLLAAFVVLIPLVTAHVPQQLSTPLVAAVPGISLLATGFAVSLAIQGLRRSALQFQQTLDERDEVLVRERTVQLSAHLAAEVERSLHDTALNTLETIAAHGGHLDPAAVAARCAADGEVLARWSMSSRVADPTQLISRLLGHARHLGLALDVRVVEPTRPAEQPLRALPARARLWFSADPAGVKVPGPVLSALDGAAREALTNVAKHSGVRKATLTLRHEEDGVELRVTDAGVGHEPPPDDAEPVGYGLTSSVAGRMAAVGGTTRLGPGPGGTGTEVVLGWWPDAEPDRPVGPSLLVLAAEIMTGIGAALTLISVAFILLGWPGYAAPLAALGSALLPLAVCVWLVMEHRAGRDITAAHVLATCAAYLIVAGGGVLADPFCSSLLGENVVLDARVPMLTVVLLLAPRLRVLLLIMATVLGAHFGSAIAWSVRWPGCGASTAAGGVYIAAGLAAAWLFIGRLSRLTEQFGEARTEAAEARVRIGAQVSVRADEEAWVQTTLASAQSLLADLASGAKLPADPLVRAECATEAQFLRGLLTVGRAPEPIRQPARIWLILLRLADCPVSVRGSFADCRPPKEVMDQVDSVIDAVCTAARGSKVALTAFEDPGGGSLTLSASGAPAAAGGDRLLERAARVAPGAWADLDADTFVVEWMWAKPGDET